VSGFGDASGLPGSITTISDRRIFIRESAAKKFEFSVFPAVLVRIMMSSFDFSLHELRKRLPKPMTIRKEKTMVAPVLFIKIYFRVLLQ
jgi:hypothetical protein